MPYDIIKYVKRTILIRLIDVQALKSFASNKIRQKMK